MNESTDGIWISWLVPNPELTRKMFEQVDENAQMNLMLHDWYYVSIKSDRFKTNGLFYTQDEPFRMNYNGDEYNIHERPTENNKQEYQQVVSLNGDLDNDLRDWIDSAASNLGLDTDQIEDQLQEPLKDLDETESDEAIVVATTYKQSLPP